MDSPSGPWTGFYNYGSSMRKHRMGLVLIFADRGEQDQERAEAPAPVEPVAAET
jgi:hypothetical protein